MPQATTAQEWDEIAALVTEHSDTLSALEAHGDLYRWAKDNDLATKRKFPKFKTELRKQLSIDYDEMRETAKARYEEEIQEKAEALNAAATDGPRLVLNSAGDAEVHSYAVCQGEKVLWYGEFFPDEKGYERGDQASADTAAMQKAVWLAAKAKEAAEVDTLMLELHVINHEVPVPVAACVKAGLGLDFHLDENAPAIEWCRENGFQSWREVVLPDLIEAQPSYDPSL